MESLIRFIRDPDNQYKPRPPRAPCPECGKELSIKWGEIKRPHLFHVRRDVKCSESLEHLLAKMIVRDTLNNDEELEFTRPCSGCGKTITSTVKLNEGETAKEEYHLGDRERADVAVTKEDGTVRLVIEILHTHRTEHREGEWYEVEAEEVIDKHSTGQRMSLNDVRSRSSDLCTCCVEPLTVLDRVRSYLNMLKPSRSEQFWSWYDVGQAIFSVDHTEVGLQIWKNFTSQTNKFSVEDCDAKWDSLHKLRKIDKLMVTIDTLEFFAMKDSPEAYETVKRRQVEDLLIKASFSQSHAKIAESFHACYPFDYACAAFTKKTWYWFNPNGRWERFDGDSNLRVRIKKEFTQKIESLKLDHETVVSRAKDAQVRSTHKSIADNLGSLIGKLESEPFQNSLCNMLRTDYSKPRFLEWKESEWAYFCCQKGVIDLRSTEAIFRPGKPEDYCTLHGCVFPHKLTWQSPDVKEVMKYLREVFGSEAQREFMLRLCASYLHSGNANKLFTIFQGQGNNSKTGFVNMLQAAFGKYAKTIQPEYFTEKKKDSGAANPGISRAMDAKLLVAQEANKETTFQEGTIKGLTGNDKRSDRDLYQAGLDMVEREPAFNLLFVVNTPPQQRDTQEAIWGRILMIVFASMWVNEDDPRLPATYDSQLKVRIFPKQLRYEDRLLELAPAFLWILFKYWRKYKEVGLSIPKEVDEAKESYRLSCDPWHLFFKARMCVDQSVQVKKETAYMIFSRWWRDSGQQGRTPSQQTFTYEMEKMFKKLDHTMELDPEEDHWVGFSLTVKAELGDPDMNEAVVHVERLTEEHLSQFFDECCEVVSCLPTKQRMTSKGAHEAFLKYYPCYNGLTLITFSKSFGPVVAKKLSVELSSVRDSFRRYVNIKLK